LFRLLTGSGCVKVCAAASSAAEGENGQEKLSCNKLKRTQQISRTGLSKPQYVTIRQIETAKKQKTKTKKEKKKKTKKNNEKTKKKKKNKKKTKTTTKKKKKKKKKKKEEEKKKNKHI
jgi:hypothetical protein